MIAQVETADGVYTVDLDDESVVAVEEGARLERAVPVPVSLPRVVAAAASGSTVVAAVDAKPPLLISHDSGRTWRESGRGLPVGGIRVFGLASDLDFREFRGCHTLSSPALPASRPASSGGSCCFWVYPLRGNRARRG